MTTGQKALQHLEWSIGGRARNQAASLRLLIMFGDFEERWKTRKFSRAAQDLTAVSFSLWRAVFLADKTSKRTAVFEDGRKFLKKVIEDNAISYPADKESREWTFNYYTRNARSSLQQLSAFWPNVAPKYEGAKRSATERWDYCQSLFDQALVNFRTLLEDERKNRDLARAKRLRRKERKKNRKTVRKMTLARRETVNSW